MTTNDIRKRFLAFFAARNHKIVVSDSVVPKDDPTVLFTTAGMQQFKRQFLGQIEGYTRAASSQKCLRTDDLDKVGKTPFHHTFFEMLGNFSFGDYFKKDAIRWAWEFLTTEMKLPVERLWVSVYKDDREAEDIWLKEIGIPTAKLVKLGDKSNFWPADAKANGPNGPCGPCSEIFYDYGENPDCPKKEKCDPDCSCGRFSEVWNLVFTQYNRKDGGVLEPLPNKNIDTGMGLERLVAVVQGKKNNFETDLFEPILTKIAKLGVSLSVMERRVIADHIRAIVFGISDGVVPSNEGRGYVIRKLIIDITDIVLRNNGKDPVIHKLVPSVVTAMGEAYPELKEKVDNVQQIVKKIEEGYVLVRKTRMPELAEKIRTASGSKDDITQKLGELFFIYRDTFGLPLETILTVAAENMSSPQRDEIIKQSLAVYGTKMTQQKDRSRAGSKMTGDVFADAELDLNVPKTEFLGYTDKEGTAKILKIFINNQDVEAAAKGDSVKIVLDRTPFYAESGGQIGDTGVITKGKSQIRITGTQKIADIFIHTGTVEAGEVHAGDTVETRIDFERRLSIMRNHTATHLLQWALRQVLGNHVQQQGSLVAEDRLRFDFTHPKPIQKTEIRKIEDLINARILACEAVQKQVMPREDAQKLGALAFFAEKYGEKVRVVSLGDYSKEFCGGTHLDSTGQIGLFKITAEGAIAQGIRRLEAVTGTAALEFINTLLQQLDSAAQVLKAPVSEVAVRAEKQAKALKDMEKKLEHLHFEQIKNSIDPILKDVKSIDGFRVICHYFDEIEAGHLRKICDLIKQKIKSGVIVLGSRYADTANLLVAVTDDLVKKNIQASELIKSIAPLIGGSGGGRPQLAQAGSKETDKIQPAIKQAEKLIEGQLSQ